MSIPHRFRQKNTLFRRATRANTVEASAYRRPLAVSQIRLFPDGTGYPICPRCQLTLAREYQSYCDRCGQALDWDHFQDAHIFPSL